MTQKYKKPTYPKMHVKEGDNFRPLSFIEENIFLLLEIVKQQNERIDKLEQAIQKAEVKV